MPKQELKKGEHLTSILKTTKLIYSMFVRVNGRWKFNPAADIYHWNSNDRAVRFFQKYLDYVFFRLVPNEVTAFFLERATSESRLRLLGNTTMSMKSR